MASNTVTTVWKENMLFESDNPSGHSVLIDTSSENGGENKGLGPKALMLSSLAGCSGLDVVSLLKKMRAEVADFKMVVHAELTEEHPKYYHKVAVEYHFYGSNLQEDKINKAVKLSIDQYCGVMEMFRQFAKVTTEVYLHEK
ncbi:OsmC family protein [Flavobacteriaceae bacterium]|jgi:putative redox protein|nr:OsmC family protein [Flavobacterium sp.]MDA9328237.1 OsmC family protein [Flavobacteriaceae bacterium]MDB9760262.1 OsmC family protein [bacterium]MBT5289950.1 OsmC family protein [Flavobacterium sp.]MBT6376845.1 OsmC family protein [Flavobacterium sp.]|tara:strand:+ start:32 stop:457 length:426 start_codon:yes stop_codon:yes gene_type:complete